MRSIEKKPEESKGQNDFDDKMDGDNDGDDKGEEEAFFNFHPQNEGMYNKKPITRKNTLRDDNANRAAGRGQNEIQSSEDHVSGIDGANLSIDQLFGRIFGIERVHVLNKSDRLQDVLEKIAIIPENKLVYVEDAPTGAAKA